jgi:hypothetical protein
MDPSQPSACLEAAARCRKIALSAATPKEWIVMAEQWEWLAETSDGTHLLARELARLEPGVSTRPQPG